MRRSAGARLVWCRAALASVILIAGAATAGPAPPIAIPAGSLDQAIAAFGRQTGISVGYAGALPAIARPAVRGNLRPEAALRRLLRGSGLKAVRIDASAYRLERLASPPPAPPRAPAAEDIVVTATKRDERLADVPFAMSVVELRGAAIGGDGATTAAIVAASGDVQLTNLGPGRNRIFVRGIADSPFAGPTQSTVSLYIDDARISFALPDPDLKLIDVRRVEVLKGPQGTLYGTGALGGIYRIVPNKPALDEWSATAAAGVSTVAHGGLGGSLDIAVNAPLAQDVAGVRIAAYAIEDGGWIDDRLRDRRNVNRTRTEGARLSALARAGDVWTIEAAGAFQDIASRDAQYATLSSGGSRARAVPIAEPSDNDFRHARLAVKGELAGADFTSTTAWVSHNVEERYDASAAAMFYARAAPLRFDQTQRLRLLTQEARLSDASATRPWVAGISLLSANSGLTGVLTGAAGPRATLLNLRHDVTEAALFGEGTARLSGTFDLTAGLRLSATRSQDESLASGREVRSTRTSLVPMAAARWRPAAGLQFYARFAGASRPGGLNPAGVPITFEHDELTSLETGGRYATADNRLSLELNLFRVRWSDIQSDLLQPNGLVTTANIGSARNLGGELTARFSPAAGWRLETTVIAQEANLARKSALGFANGTEAGLPSVPDRAARLTLARDTAVGTLRVGVAGTVRYQGRSRLSFDTALDRPMGGYAVADIEAEIAGGGWRLGIAVANLFDGDGDSFSFGNPFSIRTTYQRTPIRPRTIAVHFEHSI